MVGEVSRRMSQQIGRVRMNCIISVCGAAIFAFALATPAAAVDVAPGTYSGTSADGNDLTIVVATDPKNGDPELTYLGLNLTAFCRPPDLDYTLQGGWGIDASIDIPKTGKVKISAQFSYVTVEASLTFAADGSVSGTITSYQPTLYPVGPKPTRALFCTSPEQALSLTLQSPDTVPAVGALHNAKIIEATSEPPVEVQ
jgi:hypothetical protein